MDQIKWTNDLFLSSFPLEVLSKATKTHGWMQQEIHMVMSVNVKSKNRIRATKIEVLTVIYDLNMGQQVLF
jgi:hypothetical protein